MKILIIDDNANSNSVVKEFGELTRGYDIDTTTSIKKALKHLNKFRYDAVILDIELNGENGLEEMDSIKSLYGGPILFVSGLTDTSTVVEGLSKGADDYITKPYDLNELFLRIDRSIHRNGNYRIMEISDYRFDELMLYVEKDGKELKLPPISIKLLIYLLKNKNEVLDRNKIFEEVWGSNYNFSSRVVDSNISHIRSETKDKRIKSIRSQGYMFFEDPLE